MAWLHWSLTLDQFLRNSSLDGTGRPVGENTALRSSYEGRGRRSITLSERHYKLMLPVQKQLRGEMQ